LIFFLTGDTELPKMLLIRRYLSAAAAQVQRADDDVDDDDDDDEADADDDEAEDDEADDDEADDDEADADDVNKGMTKTSSSLFAGVIGDPSSSFSSSASSSCTSSLPR
jgi:hypothetical protein